MSEFRKVFCMYHPQEFITNFCKDKNCLMPLCPSCIGAHNQYHDHNGFRATYLNIFDSLAEVQTLMYDALINLEQDKKRNDEVIYQIHNLPSVVHEKIVMAKNIAYNVLERAFEDLEKEVMGLLEKKHEEAGVYSLGRAEKHQYQLIESISDLYEMTQNLKTQRCLAGMIKFYSESQAEASALHSQVSAALYVNENYVPNIEINEDVLNNMAAIISRMVNVSFAFPNQIEQYKPNLGPGVSNINKRVMLPYPAGPSIVSQSNTPTIVQTSPIIQSSSPIPSRTLTPPKRPQGPLTVVSQPPTVPQGMSLNSTAQNYSKIKTPSKQQTSPKRYNYLAGTNYDEQFENLSRKVKEMRKENEMLTKALKNF